MKIDNLQNQIRLEITHSELNRIKLFISALTVGFLGMGFLVYGLESVGTFFKNPWATAYIMLWIFTFIVYEVIVFFYRPFAYQKAKDTIKYIQDN